jgi:hypothetical protein
MQGSLKKTKSVNGKNPSPENSFSSPDKKSVVLSLVMYCKNWISPFQMDEPFFNRRNSAKDHLIEYGGIHMFSPGSRSLVESLP